MIDEKISEKTKDIAAWAHTVAHLDHKTDPASPHYSLEELWLEMIRKITTADWVNEDWTAGDRLAAIKMLAAGEGGGCPRKATA